MDREIGALYQEWKNTRNALRRMGKRFDPALVEQGNLPALLNSGEIEATLTLVLKFRNSNEQMLRALRDQTGKTSAN